MSKRIKRLVLFLLRRYMTIEVEVSGVPYENFDLLKVTLKFDNQEVCSSDTLI